MALARLTSLSLQGAGAAYIRVSTDQQDTERQYTSIRKFVTDHGVTIPTQHWLTDEGWARDTADHRPEFQRLIKMAEDKAVRWIVVDALDRFGVKNAKQLIAYLNRLDEAGCKLYDVTGREWTGEDIATVITAVVEGHKSRGEQLDKSLRVTGGKAAKARAGEWQGGPPRFGFDVACYSRETDKELWRVVYDGLHRRVKVYPDGTTERFDGEGNFPQHQKVTEVMQVAPSKDKGKLAAAVSVFKRFATEAVSFAALAQHLNGLGYRSWAGGVFQSHHVRYLLCDPVYIGYPTWNKRHHGKFHRLRGGVPVAEDNYAERETDNDPADWVQSARPLFKPLVDQATWAAVRAKLAKPKRSKAPVAPALYLTGLLHCGNCGARMVAGPARKKTARRKGHTDGRLEYMCGTYHNAVRAGNRAESPCLRNGVFQDAIEPYLGKYLDEAAKRLRMLTDRPDGGITGRLKQQAGDHWRGFLDGIDRLTGYLAEHHPDDYDVILNEHATDPAMTPDDFTAVVVKCYRANYDPSAQQAEAERLEAEHSELMKRWTDLPTPRAKDKAKAQLVALEQRIEELEKQREDVAGAVERHQREIASLQQAVATANIAMRSQTGERAMRLRAEAVRAVIHRIDCTFVATGETGGGPGKANTRLVAITVHTVGGETADFKVIPNALPHTSVVSAW